MHRALVVLVAVLALAAASCQRGKSGSKEEGDSPGDKKPGDTAAKKVTLPSGLAYQDLEVGTGPEEVKAGNTITCHATGWLTDGTKFWSSHDGAGAPASFTLRHPGGVIKGWVEGIPGMRVGGKRKLWIPSDLAYGARGRGAAIPPNSDLVFEVELISIDS